MINSKHFLLNSVAAAVAHGSKSMLISKIDMCIVYCLYKYQIIGSVTKVNQKYLLKLNHQTTNQLKLIVAERKHSKLKFSPANITKLKLHLQETVYIFSTPKGLKNQHELINLNMCGFLVFTLVSK